MITPVPGKRRTLEEIVTPQEAAALKEAGLPVRFREEWIDAEKVDVARADGYLITEKHRGTRRGPIYYLQRPIAQLNRPELDALRFARGALYRAPDGDNTRSPVHIELSVQRHRLAEAAPEDRLGVVLASKSWRGSTVDERRGDRGERVYVIRHPSGATMRLIAEVT